MGGFQKDCVIGRFLNLGQKSKKPDAVALAFELRQQFFQRYRRFIGLRKQSFSSIRFKVEIVLYQLRKYGQRTHPVFQIVKCLGVHVQILLSLLRNLASVSSLCCSGSLLFRWPSAPKIPFPETYHKVSRSQMPCLHRAPQARGKGGATQSSRELQGSQAVFTGLLHQETDRLDEEPSLHGFQTA